MIDTVLRLADGSTVPIRLRGTRCGWLQAVTIDSEPIKHCSKGHVILPETRHIDNRGYQRCLICQRKKWRKSNAKWRIKNREKYNAKRRIKYRLKNQDEYNARRRARYQQHRAAKSQH